MKSKLSGILIIATFAFGLFLGCAEQSLIWEKNGELDFTRGCNVSVKTSCEVPNSSVVYLQNDIQQKVKEVLAGSPDDQNAYKVEFKITKYDEGSPIRRIWVGDGQMYLEGTIEIKGAEPSAAIRNGYFKVKTNLYGVRAVRSSMKRDVLPRVGTEIVNSIKYPNL